ncbi:MAG: PAS domain S-box protein [Candidatus Hodarchaeales archaeon]|jgi:PAS domain S-box-containing protein
MGHEQLQKILDREDIPSDVKEKIKDYLLETSFPPREKIIEDNELLSAILEASPVGICLFIGSIIGWTNNTMTRVLGYNEDSLNNQEARILFPSNEEYSRVYQALYDVTDKIDVLKVESTLLHQDGSVINVILHGKPIDISNLGKGVIVAAMDVTEGKINEEKLRKSEEKHRDLINSLPGIVMETDLEGNFLFVSPQALDILGYHPEEVIGKSGFEFIHPDDQETSMEIIAKALENQYILNFEYRARHKKGHYIWFSASGRMVGEDPDIKLVMMIKDISYLKQTEDELQQSEERFRELIGNLSDIVVELDSEGNFVFISSQVYEIFGYKPEEVIGRSGFEFIHPDDLEIAIRAFEKVMGGKSGYHFEFKVKHNDGYYVPVSVSGQVIKKNNDFKLVGVISDISERKQAEEALRKSDALYNQIIENVKDIIFTLSDDGTITSLNLAFEKLTGWSRDEIIGKSWTKLIHPEDISVAIKSLKTVMNGEVPSRTEVRIKTRSDDYLVFDGRTTSLVEDGKVTGFFGVARDITQRKKIEEKLTETEEIQRKILENTDDVILLLDLEGNHIYRNPAYYRSLGFEKEEDIPPDSSARWARIHPDDLPRVKQAQSELFASGRVSTEYRFKHKDGHWVHRFAKGVLISQDGKPEAILTVINDITERKQMEEELLKFKTIADNAGYGVATSDMEGNLIYINDSFALMHGYNTGELIDKHLSIFHTKEQLKNVHRLVDQLKQKGSYVAEEVWHKRKDNTVFPTSMNGTLITDEKGTPQFMAATAIDITERMRAEEIRLELEQRRENFVWMTSHELRTPLTVVTGYVDFLYENIDTTDQDQLNTIFNNIKNNLMRLEKLTMDVSTVAQIGRGIFKITISNIYFCTFFQQAIERYKDILGNQIVFYGCQREPPLIIKGDKERFQQVIDNLVNNSIKHTHPDFRQIEVHLGIYSADVRITIKDNGAGIASNNLEKIFEQFVSIETEYSATGTGIGLYLSRKIIKAHGGTITAQSKGLGQGASFIIELPINFTNN